jgi:hypothetical protein
MIARSVRRRPLDLVPVRQSSRRRHGRQSRALSLIGGALLLACVDYAESQDACVNEPISSTVSPDARWEAVVFFRNCRLAYQEVMAVSILPANDSLPEEDDGNVFHYVDTLRPPQSLRAETRLQVPELEWKSATQLELAYDPRAGVKRMLEARGLVLVRYVKFDRP